jgi:hypothetical protein
MLYREIIAVSSLPSVVQTNGHIWLLHVMYKKQTEQGSGTQTVNGVEG